jgi:hypothetical protein
MCLSVHQLRTICSFDIWAIALPSVMKACLMPTHTPFWAMLSLSVEQHLPTNTTASTIARSTITFLVSPPLPSSSHYTPSSSIVIRPSIHYIHNTPTTENDINIRNIRYGCTPVPDRDPRSNMSPPTPSTSPSKLHWLRSLAKRIRKGFRKFRAQGLQTEMPTITITHPTNTHEEIEQPTSLIHRKDWPSPSYQQLYQWFTPEFAKILYTRGFPPTVTPTTCFCAFVIHEAERFMDPYNIGEFPRSIGDLREALSLIFTEVDVDTTRIQVFTEDRSSSLSFDCIGKRYVRKRPLMIWISHIAETIIWGDGYAEPPPTDILSVVDDSVNRDNFTPGIEHLSQLQIRSMQFQHGTDGPPVADPAENPSERSNKSIDTMRGVDSPQEDESQASPSPAPPGPENGSQPPLTSPGPDDISQPLFGQPSSEDGSVTPVAPSGPEEGSQHLLAPPGPEGDLQSSLAALSLEDDSQQQSSDAGRQQSTTRRLIFGLDEQRRLTPRQAPGGPASDHLFDLVERAAREIVERERQRELLQQDGEQETETYAPDRFATAYHRFAGLGRSAARRNADIDSDRSKKNNQNPPPLIVPLPPPSTMVPLPPPPTIVGLASPAAQHAGMRNKLDTDSNRLKYKNQKPPPLIASLPPIIASPASANAQHAGMRNAIDKNKNRPRNKEPTIRCGDEGHQCGFSASDGGSEELLVRRTALRAILQVLRRQRILKIEARLRETRQSLQVQRIGLVITTMRRTQRLLVV